MNTILFPEGLLDALRSANSVIALTGAGVSKESGIPTFREALTGLWAQYDPEELATPQAFKRDPQLVWSWYQWRRGLVNEACPNPGHTALVEMERRVPKFTLVTQNVDGLHQQAGSTNVLELHGNIMRNICAEEGRVVEPEPDDPREPPHCPHCGGLLRPDVIWFGEGVPLEALNLAAQEAETCDVFLCIGTSGLVQPAASLPVFAQQSGGLLVEINPLKTPITQLADYHIPFPSGFALPELVRQVWDSE